MDPSSDHVVDRFALPLWAHVANTFHRVEVEAVTLLGKTGDLTFRQPCAPLVNDFPAKIVDPLFRAVGSNGSISVSRVEHHAVSTFKHRVDPI